MDNQKLVSLIALFLQINPEPSDAQFHALAESVGVDHESLESIAYAMLADTNEIEQEVVAEIVQPPQTESEEVLDGEYDPNTTSVEDLVLNDGAPAGTTSQQALQDSTLNDGVGINDVGTGIDGDKDAMISDGVAPMQLKAALRLTESAG